MISLSKEESSLVLRIDLDEAPSTVEKAWAAFTLAAKLGQSDIAKIVHDMVLLAVGQVIADHLKEAADGRSDPDPEATDEPRQVH